jgi:hypothetical protein
MNIPSELIQQVNRKPVVKGKWDLHFLEEYRIIIEPDILIHHKLIPFSEKFIDGKEVFLECERIRYFNAFQLKLTYGKVTIVEEEKSEPEIKEQFAIMFAEWINLYGWIETKTGYWFNDNDEKADNTKELLELFKNQQSK